MTVSSSTDRATFAGNGVATAFSLPFRFFANSDLIAQAIVDATGQATPLTLGIDYTLTGAGQPEEAGAATGLLTTLAPVPAGVSLFVQRIIPATQPTDIVNQGRFFPEVHETVFDRLTMLVQQNAGAISRVIRVQDFDPEPGKLPSAAQRALKVMSFDENGDPVAIEASSESALFLRQQLSSADGAGLVGLTVNGTETTVAEFAQNRGTIIAKGLGVGVDSTAVIQAAVNYWDLNPNMNIRVVGHADIQGTVQIPNKETLNPERRLTITGGDLAKYNAGFMFTRQAGQSVPDGSGGTLQLQTGHVTFDDVRFLGPRTTAGTYIIDGDNVIRTKFVNCYGDGIQIAYAVQYLQSIYVDTASVFRKWKGWLFDCGYLFDVKFYGAAEAGESFIRTRDVTADPAANSLAVRGVIEGLSGKVFELGVCFGVVIDGNYQEANAGGDYDFSVGNGFHKGLTLIGNGFQPNTAQLADPNYYPVKLGKGAVNSITLIGNSSTGNLFDVPVANQSTIIDIGNWCASGKKLFSRVSREFSFSDGVEGRFRLVDGLGLGLHSFYEKFGFESTRAIVGGESVSAGLTTGAVNPQTSPGSYSQKNWAAGTFVFNKSPTIGARQYGAGVVRDALILGWVCQTSGTPGVWREVPVMLPF